MRYIEVTDPAEADLLWRAGLLHWQDIDFDNRYCQHEYRPDTDRNPPSFYMRHNGRESERCWYVPCIMVED